MMNENDRKVILKDARSRALRKQARLESVASFLDNRPAAEALARALRARAERQVTIAENAQTYLNNSDRSVSYRIHSVR